MHNGSNGTVDYISTSNNLVGITIVFALFRIDPKQDVVRCFSIVHDVVQPQTPILLF